MFTPMLLEGKIALVTGAAHGNGAAIARGLAMHGATVVLTDIDEDTIQSEREHYLRNGHACHAYRLDVSDMAECAAVAERVGREVGDLDILVNNAGIRPRHPFDYDDRDLHWRRAMSINLDGIRHTTLTWHDALRRQHGTVINITSIAGVNASPGSIAYSTSKAGAQMLSKVLACELAADGIRVNAIAPGVIETEMTRPSREEPVRRERLLARIPMGRFGRPDELVGAVLFLASDLSSYVTGSTIAVDGGYLSN